MTRVVMYSTGLCPYCFMAKRLLDRRGIAYEERRLRRSQRARLVPLGGGMTFPQILVGERVVDGWSELRRMDQRGELTGVSA